MSCLGVRLARSLAVAALALAAALCAIALPTFVDEAYASTGYTATATSHYSHPATGMVEDSGGGSSEVLGQSMTDGATYPYAFVEIDDAGNTYVTIRLKLMYAIVDPQFQIDTAWSGVFSSLSSDCVQTNDSESTADFRMLVPSSGEGAVFRCSMYVTPMGREVIFYITLSNYVEGNSYGFYQSASSTTGEQGAVTLEATPDTATEESTLDTSALEQTIADAKALSQGSKSDTAWSKLRQAISAAESSIVTATDQDAVDAANEALLAAIEEFNASEDVDPEEESASGLVEFDAEGNVVSTDEDGEEGDFPIVPVVIAIIVVVAVAAVGIVAWRRSAARASESASAAQAAAPAAAEQQGDEQGDATPMSKAAAGGALGSDLTLPLEVQQGDADSTQPLSSAPADGADDTRDSQRDGRDA